MSYWNHLYAVFDHDKKPECLQEHIFPYDVSTEWNSPFLTKGIHSDQRLVSRMVGNSNGDSVIPFQCPVEIKRGLTVATFLKFNQPTRETSIIFHLRDPADHSIEASYRFDEQLKSVIFRFSCTYFDWLFQTKETIQILSKPMHFLKVDYWHFLTFVLNLDLGTLRVYTGSGVLVANLEVPSICEWRITTKANNSTNANGGGSSSTMVEGSSGFVEKLLIGSFYGNEQMYCLQLTPFPLDDESEIHRFLCNCRKLRPCDDHEMGIVDDWKNFPLNDKLTGPLKTGFWPLAIYNESGWSMDDIITGRNSHKSHAQVSPLESGREWYYVTSQQTNLPMVHYNLTKFKLFNEGLTITFYFHKVPNGRVSQELVLEIKSQNKNKNNQTMKVYVMGREDSKTDFHYVAFDWISLRRYNGRTVLTGFQGVNNEPPMSLYGDWHHLVSNDDRWELVLHPKPGCTIFGLGVFGRVLDMTEIRAMQKYSGQLLPISEQSEHSVRQSLAICQYQKDVLPLIAILIVFTLAIS